MDITKYMECPWTKVYNSNLFFTKIYNDENLLNDFLNQKFKFSINFLKLNNFFENNNGIIKLKRTPSAYRDLWIKIKSNKKLIQYFASLFKTVCFKDEVNFILKKKGKFNSSFIRKLKNYFDENFIYDYYYAYNRYPDDPINSAYSYSENVESIVLSTKNDTIITLFYENIMKYTYNYKINYLSKEFFKGILKLIKTNTKIQNLVYKIFNNNPYKNFIDIFNFINTEYIITTNNYPIFITIRNNIYNDYYNTKYINRFNLFKKINNNFNINISLDIFDKIMFYIFLKENTIIYDIKYMHDIKLHIIKQF